MWPFDLNFWRGFWEAFGQWPLQTSIVAAVALVLIAIILSHTYLAISKWRDGVETRRLEAFGNLTRQNELLLRDVEKLRTELRQVRIQSREIDEQNVELHTRLRHASEELVKRDSLLLKKEKLLTETKKNVDAWVRWTLEACDQWLTELDIEKRPYDEKKANKFRSFVDKISWPEDSWPQADALLQYLECWGYDV